MRAGLVGYFCVVLAAAAPAALAQTPSPSLPTPATPGPNPGAAATDAITNPIKPAPIEPPAPSRGTGATPGAPPAIVAPAPPSPRASAPDLDGDLRELLELARQIAKATRDEVDYSRVVPDILTQILAKLDKIENKLDKVENAVKASRPKR